MDKSLILNRIKEHLFFKTDKEFADYLGVKPNTLSTWHKRNSIDYELIIAKCDFVNANWLLTGNGSMLKAEEKEITIEKSLSIKIDDHPSYTKPLIPLEAMAGFFSHDNVQVMGYECELYSVPMLKDADFLIPVAGDSMYPTYNNGDIVACKRIESWDFFIYGKVYVLYTSHGVLLKRIRQGSDNEHILVVSDNENSYPAFELHKKELKGVAIVIGGLWAE